MAGKKSTIEELVSDDVAIFLKNLGSAVTVVPFREPQRVQLDESGNIIHPLSIVDAPMFNREGWNHGYTRGEVSGGRDTVLVQYYRYKVGVYDPPGN